MIRYVDLFVDWCEQEIKDSSVLVFVLFAIWSMFFEEDF